VEHASAYKNVRTLSEFYKMRGEAHIGAFAMTNPGHVSPLIEDSVSGFLHKPDRVPSGNLVLTHGAGSNCRSPLLLAVAEAFCRAGFLVLRCDLPFRQRRSFGPPLPKSAAEDRGAIRAAAVILRRLSPAPVFLAGHSYGGRQASMLAADEPEICSGLLLLSYPLHPPNKPTELRTAHFPSLHTPALFISGTKDPFASTEEMRSALQLIPATTKLLSIEGAGHELARGKFDIQTTVLAEFSELLT
jgi:predicted alpha/beta-hydrolase family hydrolase